MVSFAGNFDRLQNAEVQLIKSDWLERKYFNKTLTLVQFNIK